MTPNGDIFFTQVKDRAARRRRRELPLVEQFRGEVPPVVTEPELEPETRIAEIEGLLAEPMPQQERTPLELELEELRPEVIPEIARPIPAEEDLSELFRRVYPDFDFGTETGQVVLSTMMQWAEESPEAFLEDIWVKGRTEDTEALLRAFGAQEEVIEEIFAPPPIPEPLAIPHDGLKFTLEVEEPVEPYIREVEVDGVTVRRLSETAPVRKLAILRPDYTIEVEDTVIGTYNPETGEIKRDDPTTIELAKQNLDEAWKQYIRGEFKWGEFGDLALGTLGVGGAYIEKHVGRPWETAVLEARSRFQQTTGLGTEMDEVALQRLREVRRQYGWAGALTAEEVSDIWHDYVEDTTGPASVALNVVEWLNPAYIVPIGGTIGLFARFTTKIPLLGKVMKWTASGVQYVERGITYPVAKPVEAGIRFGAKGAEAVGKRIGTALGDRLIKQTDNLILTIPETERLLDGVLVDNWIKRAITTVAKIPPVKVGIEKALGWRILVRRNSQVIEDVVGRGGVVNAEITRMGTNAKAIKYWELQEVSRNPTKLFGFNKNAYSPKMANRLLPEFAAEKEFAGTLEHVFTKPEMYSWSGMEKGLEYVSKVHEINTEMLNLLKLEGVAPKNLAEDWWIHRVVEGKFSPEGELIKLRGRPGVRARGRIGVTPSYEMHRKAPTMAEGMAWGIQYARDPTVAVTTYIEEAFKKIADQRFIKYIEQFGGITPTARLAERFPELVERAALTQKELADAAYFSSVINRAIRGEKLTTQTLNAIERKFPELGGRFKALSQEPIRAEAQVREILAQNQKTIRQLQTRLDKAEAVDIEAIKASAREEAVRIGIPDDQKLTEAFRLMEIEDRLAFRSTMESQLDDAGRMITQYDEQIAGMKEFLAVDPVATARFTIAGKKVDLPHFISLREQTFPEYFTVKEAQALFPKHSFAKYTQKGLKTYNKVPRDEALDDLTKRFGMTPDEIAERVMRIRVGRADIKDIEFIINAVDNRYKGIDRMLKVLDNVDADVKFIPKAPEGMPEAGLQQDFYGYQHPKFPKGKGEITQVSMDDYQKLVKARKDAGLPPPDVGVKPKIDGIKGFEAETTIEKVSVEIPVVKPVAAIEAELKALRTEVKAITEARKAPFWKAKSEKALQMEKVRQPEIGEGYIMQPFAGGKIYDQEFVDAFNKFFGHKGGLTALNVTSDVAGILRITKAALDFSMPAIQGLPSWGLAHSYLLIDPPTGARLLGAWYKTFVQSTAAFFRPEVLAAAIKKIQPSAMERVSFGGSARAVDYFQVLWTKKGLAGAFQKTAGKIPFKPYDRAEIAFFGAGELVRDRFWKILGAKAIRNGKEFELARFLDRFTGITDSATLGVPMTVRQLEQTFVWFAPNYTRACLTVLSDLFRGGYTGAMAREALGGMIAAGSAMYSGIQYAIATTEGLDNEQAWKRVLEGFGVKTDPITGEVTWQPTGTFMTLKIGNYYMGFGGFWYGLLRLSGNIMATIDEVGEREVIDLVRIMKNGSFNKKDNPFIYWWYSRSSPFFGTGFELADGKDFLGYPIEGTEDYLKYIATRFEPIWMEQGLNWLVPGMARDHEIPEDLARAAIVPAELFGLRTFPESQWTIFYDKANELIKHIPAEELDPKQVDAWKAGELTWKQLTDIQRINLLSRYPELEDLYGQSQSDSAVRGSENWKQWQGRIEEEKTSYYIRGDGLVDRLITGDLDTREFREMWSEAGQNYGIALDTMEKEPAYEEIYGYFDKKEAKGEKYGFYDNLALGEYIEIVFADYLDSKGDIDWDEKDRQTDAFIEKWGEDTYQRIRQMYADKKRLEGLHPTLIRMADDKDKLSRDYWRLPYKPINEMDEADELEGNIPAEYYALWQQYQALETDKEREAFIETHPDFGRDWREEFRLKNPEQDAMLALWGYGGKLQSREAYDLVTKWSRELGIPLEQMGLGLPPPSLIDNYFDLNKIVSETSGSSVEARLFKLENPNYLAWGLEQGIWKDDLSDESIESLRLRFKHKDTFAEYELVEDREEQKKFRLSHPEFNDDRRRITMYGLEADVALIEKYVEYGKIVDKYGGASAEARLFKIDNPDLHQFGQSEEVFGWDDLKDEKVEVLRINEQFRNEDAEYNSIQFVDAKKQAEVREDYLRKHSEYAVARRRRDAFNLDFPDNLVQSYVDYYILPEKGYRRNRFLLENKNFYNAMLEKKELMPFATDYKVPHVRYDEIYEKWAKLFDQYETVTGTASQRRDARSAILRDNLGFAEDRLRRIAYGSFFPEKQIEKYVSYYSIIARGKPEDVEDWYEDDWFLMENPSFYETAKTLLGWEGRDFSKVPTREVYDLYQIYREIDDSKEQLNYRVKHRDLDEWGQKVHGWKPAIAQVNLEFASKEDIINAITRLSDVSDEEKARIEGMSKEDILDALSQTFKGKIQAFLNRGSLTKAEKEAVERMEESKERAKERKTIDELLAELERKLRRLKK